MIFTLRLREKATQKEGKSEKSAEGSKQKEGRVRKGVRWHKKRDSSKAAAARGLSR